MSRLASLGRAQRAALLIAIVVTVSIVLLSFAEAAVRIRHTLKYGGMWGIEETYRLDPQTGLRVPVAGGEFGPVRINSLGFRGPEIAARKPAGTLRLAFLGASTTYCAEVSSNDAAWPHLVRQDLAAMYPQVEMDYVNAAVPGYGVLNSLTALQHRVAPLEPDVIVIYHATNDLSHHSFDAAVAEGVARERTAQQLSAMSRYSLLVYLVEKNLRVMKEQQRAASSKGKLAADPRTLAEPFEADLTRLVLASQNVAEVVAVATFAPQLRRTQTADEKRVAARTSLYYMPYMTPDSLIDSFEAYNAAIARVAGRTGALLIDGEANIPGDAIHYVDSVHFTDRGSASMAARVTATLAASEQFDPLVRSIQ